MLGSLLEAARWAASSSNEQPWRFIVATKARTEEFAALLACLAPGNQVWAQQASVLILTVAKRHFDDGTENRHAWYDVGQAAAHLAIQATAMGLMVHQMAGFASDKAREAFGIPDGFDPVTAIAVGYQGEVEALPERLQKRERAPRSRVALDAIASFGRWGQALPFAPDAKTAPPGA